MGKGPNLDTRKLRRRGFIEAVWVSNDRPGEDDKDRERFFIIVWPSDTALRFSNTAVSWVQAVTEYSRLIFLHRTIRLAPSTTESIFRRSESEMER